LGHWIVARAQGEKPSLPLFIPFPFSLVGTLGAVIIQQTPFKNRRALLQMALAGPALGFLVAVPMFVAGILISEIKPIPPDGAMFLGDSLLTRAISLIRPVDISTGVDIFLHPIGMAGWIGLLLTGVNLLAARRPAGWRAHCLRRAGPQGALRNHRRHRGIGRTVAFCFAGVVCVGHFAGRVWAQPPAGAG
jgi:hypothetical protein